MAKDDGFSPMTRVAHSAIRQTVNDAIRAALPVKKVTSSRKKKETVILSEKLLDPEEVRQAINNAGYYMLSFKTEQVQKRSAFSRLLGKKG